MTDQANPMVITLDHFNKMRDNFKKHYFLENCNSDFQGQDIQIQWSLFSLVVENFIKSVACEPDEVALRFVLCYDANKNELYLRLQICTMVPDPDKPGAFILDAKKCAWYTIADGSIAPTGVTTLEDKDYFTYFYYCDADACTPDTLVNLASDATADKFVRNLTYPWAQEIQKINIDNGSPANSFLCFAAGCEEDITAKVAFQHTLAIYMRKYDDTAMLDNYEYTAEFQMKAGDMGTLCPVNCNIYMLPK